MLKFKKMKDVEVLQSFGIILVVLGHSIIAGVDFGPTVKWLWNTIYSFHMPLFFAISGYLFIISGGNKSDYTGFIRSKIRRLIVPYIVISSVAFIPKALLSKMANRPIDLSFMSYFKTLLYPLDNTIVFFWFAPTLFLIFAISPVFQKAIKTEKGLILFIVTLCLTLLYRYNPIAISLFNISGAIYYAIYFWIGCIFACYRKYIDIFLRKGFKPLIVLTMLFLIQSVGMFEFAFSNICIALTGIGMSFVFARLYIDNKCTFLDSLSGYSYQIYLLSWFPQVLFDLILRKTLDLNTSIVALCMFIGGLMVPVYVTKVIDRYLPSYSPLVGRSSSKAC